MLKTLMPSLKELISSDYNSIKTAETESLIRKFMQNLVPSAHPELLQISGIPGAGKSTYCAKHLPQNFLFLSFDKIMLALPSYKRDLQLYGNVTAYKNNEMPARIIGYEILRRATAQKLNIMFEHSGTNNAHLELFKNITRQGYHTAVNFIMCDTELAIQRAKERARNNQRFVPESLIRERANGFKNYINAYRQLQADVTVMDGTNNFQLLKKI